MLLTLSTLLVIAIVFAVAGEQAPAVLQACAYGLFSLPVIVSAGMLGIAITSSFAKHDVFVGEPDCGWPEAFRLIVAIAIGLGSLSLGMLMLGSLGWVQPLPLLAAAIGIGVVPTRTFLESFDRSRFLNHINREHWLILLAAFPIAILLIAASHPPGTLWLSEARGYDVLAYHLQLLREYAANSSTAPLSHNVYSYLPANVEMLYLMLMQLTRLVMDYGVNGEAAHLWAIYPSQFLHAFMMMLAVAAIAVTPIRINSLGRIIAMLTILGIPWTLITGSLAYNEGGMMLFGTLALLLAFANPGATGLRSSQTRAARSWFLIGILLGLAVGCKPTAGIFFAIPIALIVVVRNQKPEARSQKIGRAKALGIVAGVALLLYAPWALRAAIPSGGNPFFPLAANVLPSGNWTPEQITRFNQGHAAKHDGQQVALTDLKTRTKMLIRETVLHNQWSHFRILWLAAPIAILLALLAGLRRPGGLTGVSLLMATILIQVIAWLFLTHLQSRFLLPMAVPIALLVALAVQGPGKLRIILTALIAIHATSTVFLLRPEINKHEKNIATMFERVFNLAAEEGEEERGGEGKRGRGVLLEGNAAPFYWLGNIHYHTVFDKNPLADHLRISFPTTLQWLQNENIRYLVFDWPEIARLRRTYPPHGYDPFITPELIPSLESLGLQNITPPKLPLTILRVPTR